MFLLVTGASGAEKSTARQSIADELKPGVKCVELHDVVEVPRVPTKAWRQQATEAVVRHALALQAQGRDLLLAGADRGGWTMYVFDTSSLNADAVAAELLAWCRRALGGQAPAMRVRS